MEVIIKSRKPQYTTIKCPGCSANVEFEIPTAPGSGSAKFKVQCYNSRCERLIPYDPNKPPTPTHNGSSKASSSFAGASGFSANGAKSSTKPFKLGTDEEPASMEYYELLGVPPTADTIEIKKAYYRLAMKYHPDKNKTPEAEEMFKKISEAYQILSDPVLRKNYNEFGPGKGSDPEGGFINPEEFFKMQFGGELFVDIIGELQIAKEFKNMMTKNGEGEEGEEEKDEDISVTLEKRREELELKRKVREERVALLSQNLIKKLNIYLETGADNFRKVISEEAEELKVQSYGVHLLHSIGYIYSVKACEYMSKYNDDILAMPSFVHRMRLKGRAFSETFSTVKSAVDVHHTFVQLQEAEKTGCTEAEREKLTEEAVKKGTDAIWKTSKLEVESVIRSVCDKTLTDTTADRVTLKKRSEALKIVGDIYQSVTPPQMPPNNMFM